jgi:dTDP-4-dehydrorhamnose 3,5-epimerase
MRKEGSMDTDKIRITDAPLNGVKIICPYYMEDNRGYFLKDMEQSILKAHGLEADIRETFESGSRKGVIRGLHFQTFEPQVKIVRAVYGSIRDVVLDLRKNSADFGKHMGIELNDRNHLTLYIPAGFAHGFKVLSDYAVVAYKCIGAYRKDKDSGIIWNDPDLAIDWGEGEAILADRDRRLMKFREFCSIYGGL